MTANQEIETRERAGSVEKALDVLLHLHRADGALGVTAVGRALGMPKSSAHRLLTALAARGLVERDERGRYRPGFALVALGLGVLASEPVVGAARPVLEDAAAEIGETVFLVGARAGRLVVLDKAEGTGFLRAAPRVGAHVPVHATAVGKLYRAFAPERALEEPGPRERFTARTLTHEAELAEAAAEARERGWALNRDEWIEGLSVLAAPVLASAGRLSERGERRLVGAVALAAASPRLREIGLASGARAVCAAAERVAARLDGRELAADAASRRTA